MTAPLDAQPPKEASTSAEERIVIGHFGNMEVAKELAPNSIPEVRILLLRDDKPVWNSSDSGIFKGYHLLDSAGEVDLEGNATKELHLIGTPPVMHFFLVVQNGRVRVKTTFLQDDRMPEPLISIASIKRPVFLASDGAFEDILAASANTGPLVALWFESGRFRLVPDLMRSPVEMRCLAIDFGIAMAQERDFVAWRPQTDCPDSDETSDSSFTSLVTSAIEQGKQITYEDLRRRGVLEAAADLMHPYAYAGRFNEAKIALKKAWPKNLPWRTQFESEYWRLLHASKYWLDIQQMNRLNQANS
jgi:hypothetical protein